MCFHKDNIYFKFKQSSLEDSISETVAFFMHTIMCLMTCLISLASLIGNSFNEEAHKFLLC